MKVGFIGLGRMGGHMCSNVIKAGFETYVSDLVPALVEQKVAEGAIGCKEDRKSTRLNSSHRSQSRMPSSA